MQCLKVLVTLVLGRPCWVTAPQGLGVLICKMGTKSLAPSLSPSSPSCLPPRLWFWAPRSSHGDQGLVCSRPLGLGSLCSPLMPAEHSLFLDQGLGTVAPCAEIVGHVGHGARTPGRLPVRTHWVTTTLPHKEAAQF